MRGDGRVTAQSAAAHGAIGIAAIVPAHIELPSQYADRHRRGAIELQPEKRLMLAVLEDAIETFRRYRGARDAKGRALAADAADWLASDDEAWLYSYRRCCEAVGIDADYLRRGLRAWQDRTPPDATAWGRDPGRTARVIRAVEALIAAGWVARRIGPAIGYAMNAADHWRRGQCAVSEEDVRRLEALVAQSGTQTATA